MLLRMTVITGFNVITSVVLTPFALPVMVTLVDLVTAEETALKLLEVAPAAIVTDDGTCREGLLLVSVTLVEDSKAPLKDTVHALDCDPVSVCVPHEIPLNAGVVELPPELLPTLR